MKRKKKKGMAMLGTIVLRERLLIVFRAQTGLSLWAS